MYNREKGADLFMAQQVAEQPPQTVDEKSVGYAPRSTLRMRTQPSRPASTPLTPDYAGSAPGARPGRRVRAVRLPASAGSPPGSVSFGG